MNAMLGISIYAIYAKSTPFSGTVQRKCIAMSQARRLNRLSVHKVIKSNQVLQFILASG